MMRGLVGAVLVGLLLALGLYVHPAPASSTTTLKAFANDKDLVAFLKRRVAGERRRMAAMPPPPVLAPAPPPAPMVAPPSAAATSDVVTTAARASSPSITNTQEANVDEGGIVKVHGNHLVVLRRGRLFTVDVSDRARAVDQIDAFPPGTSGSGAWYDEMLVSGDRVIVVGYSYERGGTEINRFSITDNGRLRFEDSYHLRSNDYYSSSNYASRLIGDTLIFYTPLTLDINEPIAAQLPGLSRWTGAAKGSFERIAPATRVYLPEPVRRDPGADIDTLHTVTTCNLAAVRMACSATGVLGSRSRDFYVSGQAVYVWIDRAFGGDGGNHSIVYRLPLDGSRPGAAQVWGGPVDQFSFREDQPRHALDVLVRADAGGERMWRSEVSEGDAALLHLPISLFGDGSAVAPARSYRPLPLNRQPNWSFHNRFVGPYLIYSAGDFAAEAGVKTVFAAPVNGGAIAKISAPHGVDRIDIMGSDAVVIGSDSDGRLGFSSIELTGAPRLGDTSFLPAAREGERRSQAFFYRPDPESRDGASGTLGLPVSRDLGTSPAARFLGAGSAVAFLRRNDRRFTPAGELEAHAEVARDDGCQASCVDWYGNARPIFLGNRTFALMGYELVEGRMENGRISEVRRLNFAPSNSGRP